MTDSIPLQKRLAAHRDGSASDMDLSQSDSDAPPAGASSSRARRGAKKSAARVDTDEDDEDDEDRASKGGRKAPSEENPYPVEGIYKDSAERSRVSKMSELEREDFIATRKEEINERATRAEVAKLARASDARRGGGGDDEEEEGEGEDDDDDDEYGGGARETRSRKVTGASKTKSEGLEKLKKSRAEKGKKREKADSSDDEYEEPGRKKGRKASPSASASSDMDVSDSDDDTAAAAKKKKAKKAGPDPLGPSELRDITLTRAKLAEMCRAPWFKEWVQGAFVRVTVGPDLDNPAAGNKYRVAMVTGLKEAKQPYRVEGSMTEYELELTIGTDKGRFGMVSVSNSPVTDREYMSYIHRCKGNDVNPMSSKEAGKVKAQLAKHTSYTLTEEDLQKQLEASGAAMRGPGAKTRLKIQRDHALAAGDEEKVKELNEKLAALDAPTGAEQDRARLINERNRANNREEIRRAEAKSQEQRRKQAELLARGDTDVRIDPSARVKTMPRLNYDNSRPQTPGPGSGTATPTKGGPLAAAAAAAAAAAENGTPRQRGSKIEVASQVAINVDDLLDFCASSLALSLSCAGARGCASWT
ncbi:Pol II transcription elongation factor [Rhodotorula diobovata]|uniref:Pol II transcription elongation factor n=1 Tax=Rhodotorula diobovata TaxID=5288 RepID=A0A5C5FTQ2_9BASI|nr:Pol II transcription elongation factor [Rhodotorula diobovata]